MRKNSLAFVRPGPLLTMVTLGWMCFVAAPAALAQDAGLTADEALVALLDEFVAGASSNDITAHERFWSDDLVYTSSAGERFGKADIIKSMQDAASGENAEAAMVYGREALLIRVYDDVAVVTFRLVATRQSEPAEVMKFYNTGTFLLRDGEWRAIAWQATRIPEEP